MQAKQVNLKVKGMSKDTSESVFDTQYAYDIKNMRFLATDDTTQMSLVNEKGTTEINVYTYSSANGWQSSSITGTVIGYTTIDKYIVLFTHQASNTDKDHIYVIYEDTQSNVTHFRIETKFSNSVTSLHLSFSFDNPIEALPIYETEDIIKVYWVDGLNQPRVINIKSAYTTDIHKFDFLPAFDINPNNITVTRNESGGGMFPGGTLLYVMTYSNMNGQETSIIWLSDLLYTTFTTRGVSPEEYTTSTYTITIQSGTLSEFDYINIYSILQTSEKGDRVVKLVKRVKVSENASTALTLIDDNTNGSIIDSTSLLFKGSDNIVAHTLNVKDNTLFLGNIETKLRNIEDYSSILTGLSVLTDSDRILTLTLYKDNTYYNFKQLPAIRNDFKYLKKDNYYRIGLQFQDKYGKWSNPKFIEDFKPTKSPTLNSVSGASDNEKQIGIPTYKITLSLAISSQLQGLSYRNVRSVIVFPDKLKRTVAAQGIVAPTLFTPEQRNNNTPFAFPSWFFRPYSLMNSGYDNDWNYNTKKVTQPAITEARNLHSIGTVIGSEYGSYVPHISHNITNCEVLGMELWSNKSPLDINQDVSYITTGNLSTHLCRNYYYIDLSIQNFYSPDIEDLDAIDLVGVTAKIIGFHFINSASGTYDLLVSSIENNIGGVLSNKNIYKLSTEGTKDNLLISSLLYTDKGGKDIGETQRKRTYLTYPWHNANQFWSVTDDEDDDTSPKGVIVNKIFSNLRISQAFYFFQEGLGTRITNYDITPVEINDGTTTSASRLAKQSGITYTNNMSNLNYVGGIDLLFMTYNSDGYGKAFKLDEVPQSEYVNWDSYLLPTSTTGREINYTDVDATPIKFKTCKHAVFAFNKTADANGILRLQFAVPKVSSSLLEKVLYLNYQNPFWINNSTFNNYGSIVTLDALMSDEVLNEPVGSPASFDLETLKTVLVNTFHPSPSVQRTISVGVERTVNNVVEILLCKMEISNATLQSDIPIYAPDSSIIGASIIKFTQTAASGEGLLPTHFSINTYYAKERDSSYDVSTAQCYKLTVVNIHPKIIDVSGEYSSFGHSANELMWIVELQRTFNNGTDVFGSSTDLFNLSNHKWMIGGPTVKLTNDASGVVVPITNGDTVFDRYDCLKTMPIDINDISSGNSKLIEIMSVMCESYQNNIGRYDKNRGLEKNTNISDLNFNLYNTAYNNTNDYFIYRIPETLSKNTKYPNAITWSLTKTTGENIDVWTNINLASILELDGDRGKIISIKRLNNDLIVFLEKGISLILYNESMLIQSTAGLPIEIANSGKVNGKRYISSTLGTYNKQSVIQTPYGIYFTDENTKDIYLFNGQMKNISFEKGLHVWTSLNLIFNNAKTYYDSMVKDILFTTANNALCFNEAMNEFTSFYDYNNIDALFTLKNNSYVIKNNISGNTNVSKLYSLRTNNDYCKFFGEQKGYSIEYLVNPEPTLDKIFTNMNFRSDAYTISNNQLLYLPNITFNKIHVHNEYLNTNEIDLVTSHSDGTQTLRNGILRKKFRVWNINIPRDSTYKRDRIRNMWAYIKLIQDNSTNSKYKNVLHDVSVTYFI